MDAHWDTVKELVADALELPAAERSAFLDARCQGTPDLRAEVEELLRASTDSEDLLDAGAEALFETTATTPAPAAAEARLTAGTRIGPFEIQDHLGEGGFADVYLARQRTPIDRNVALKRLKPGMDSRAILLRFDAERRTLARLQHPHIARVLDAGADDAGRPWVAMDLVRGEPLTTFVAHHDTPLATRLELFLQTCDAVEHAHRRGVLHRDLKPSNVLVDTSHDHPRVQVIDFGIARLLAADADITDADITDADITDADITDADITDADRGTPTLTAPGMFLGTPAYASPEQLAGDRDLDTRVDVYALGVILYELLTGRRPFDQHTFSVHDRLRTLRERSPERPSQRVQTTSPDATTLRCVQARVLRGELDWITLRALEADRDRRYPSVAALAEDLRRADRGEPVEAGPPSTSYRLRRFAGRHRALVAGATLALLALVAGGTAATIGLVRARDARADAQREARAARAARAEALDLAAREAAAKDEALALSAESDAVSEFLADLLQAATPDELGRDVTVLEVLDGAQQQLDRLEHSTDVVGTARARVEARLRHVIGSSYQQLGDFDAAEAHLVRAEQLARELFGPGSDDHLDTLLTLARLRSRQTRNAEAEELFADYRQLASDRGLAGRPDHRRALLEFQATNQFERSDFDTAHATFVELLDLDETHGSPQAVVATLGNLAQTCVQQHDFAAALDHAQRAWQVGRDQLGPTWPQTILAGRTYGLTLLRSDPARAREVLEQVAAASTERFGTDHYQTLGIQGYLAYLMQVEGDLPGAAQLYATILPQLEEAVGPTARQTLMAAHNLGMVQLSQEQHAEAALTLDDALQRFLLARGPDHPETLFCEVHLHTARSGAEGPVAVDPDYADAIERFLTAVPETHPLFGETLSDYGHHLLDLSQASDRLAKSTDEPSVRASHVDAIVAALERALQAFRRGGSSLEHRALSWLVEANRAYDRSEAAARWRQELNAYERDH